MVTESARSPTTVARADQVAVRLPRWHVVVAATGLAGSIGLLTWAAVSSYRAGLIAGLVLIVASLYGVVDATTTRMGLAHGRLMIRDRIVRARSIPVDEIRSITYIPGELFLLETEREGRIGFPAGATGLSDFCLTLRDSILARRELVVRGKFFTERE